MAATLMGVATTDTAGQTDVTPVTNSRPSPQGAGRIHATGFVLTAVQ